jgi:sterol desaturase/sphingolipid hydroxylase (fatty acid hydroxylase superfamily)
MDGFLSDAARLWMGELAPTLTRYAILAIGVWLVLWVLLARLIRTRKIRETSPPHRQLAIEFFYSLRSMVLFATFGVAVDLASRAGLYPLADMATRWGAPWLVASVVIGVVAHDAYVYWVHRLMHRPRWFRRTHRRHHLSNNPSPFTAYSFDVNEALLMVGFAVVFPLVFPMHWGAMSWVMMHQIVRNTFLHSGYELTPARANGRPWFDFLTTTTHHDLHHAQAGYNFAPWFTWWDRALGTEHPAYHAEYAKVASRRIAAPAGAPALGQVPGG